MNPENFEDIVHRALIFKPAAERVRISNAAGRTARSRRISEPPLHHEASAASD